VTIEYPKCPTCSRDIEGYEDDDPDPTRINRIQPDDRPLPARHFVTAVPCGHRVKTEGLQWVARNGASLDGAR
jgi:hypothetical protein